MPHSTKYAMTSSPDSGRRRLVPVMHRVQGLFRECLAATQRWLNTFPRVAPRPVSRS